MPEILGSTITAAQNWASVRVQVSLQLRPYHYEGMHEDSMDQKLALTLYATELVGCSEYTKQQQLKVSSVYMCLL